MKRPDTHLSRTLAVLILSFATAAAAHAQESPAGARIGVVVHKTEGFHNAFWDSLQMGARKAGKELGATVSYHGIPAAYAEMRVDGQIQVFDRLIEEGYDAIVFTPVDRIRMAAAVKKAVVRGIAVVAIDSPVESNLLSAIIATNNYEASLTATRRMTELMKGRGSVIMLAHPSRENKATRDREQAFLAAIGEYGGEIRVLSSDRFGGATIDSDYPVALSLLEDFPDVTGIYCVSGSGLVAFARALDAKGLAGKIVLVGWDADSESIQGLRSGTVSIIVQQRPERMGYEGVMSAMRSLSGDQPRRDIDTGTILITRQNMDEPGIRDLVSPDFRGWVD